MVILYVEEASLNLNLWHWVWASDCWSESEHYVEMETAAWGHQRRMEEPWPGI